MGNKLLNDDELEIKMQKEKNRIIRKVKTSIEQKDESVILSSSSLSKFPVIKILELDIDNYKYKNIKSFQFWNKGKQVLHLSNEFCEIFPNLEYISLQGNINVLETLFDRLTLKGVSISDNEIISKNNYWIVDLLHKHPELEGLTLGNISFSRFLSKINKDISLHRLYIYDVDFKNKELINFVQKINPMKLELSGMDLTTIPQEYFQISNLSSFSLFNSSVYKLPKSIINRVLRFRLSNNTEKGISYEFYKTNLPACIEGQVLSFPDDRYVTEKDFYPHPIDRIEHYIEKHQKPEIYETLPSCSNIERKPRVK